MTDDRWIEELKRKHISRRGVMAVGAAAAFLAACSKKVSQGTGGGGAGAVPETLEGELSIYNWADYVHPKTYSAFEKEFDVKITEDNFPSNEDALAKLQAGAKGYDLVVPTGYMVEIMIEEGLLTEIDHSKVPNLDLVEPEFLDTPFDPGNKYSIPKDFGTTGYGVRTKLVKEEMTSWEDFYRLASKYSGRYTVLDSSPEVVGSALKMLGYSYNSTDPKEISEATRVILKLKPHVRKITSSMRELMISGEAYVCLTWNGEIGYVTLDAKDAVYVVPSEGTEIWTDNWSIVAGAPHPAAAHAYLNWSLEPKVQARDTSYHYYGDVVEGAEQYLPKAIASDQSVYPSAEVRAKSEFAQASPEWLALRNEAWTKFKAA